MLSEVKVRNTKKGDKMAMLRLEDLTAQVDGVVFPKSFERLEALLQTDARLMVWGKVDRRDEMLQLIVDDAEPIDEVQIVMIEIDVQRAKNIQNLHQLKEILLGKILHRWCFGCRFKSPRSDRFVFPKKIK